MNKLHTKDQNRFEKAITAIQNDDFEDFDYKKLIWYEDLFRIRIWDYRIIFRQSPNWNKIIKIQSR